MALAVVTAACGGWLRCVPWQEQPFKTDQRLPPRTTEEEYLWFCNDTKVAAAMQAVPAPQSAFKLPCAVSANTLPEADGSCRRCNCTFLDVGLNNGNSLMMWPGNLSQHRHVFGLHCVLRLRRPCCLQTRTPRRTADGPSCLAVTQLDSRLRRTRTKDAPGACGPEADEEVPPNAA